MLYGSEVVFMRSSVHASYDFLLTWMSRTICFSRWSVRYLGPLCVLVEIIVWKTSKTN